MSPTLHSPTRIFESWLWYDEPLKGRWGQFCGSAKPLLMVLLILLPFHMIALMELEEQVGWKKLQIAFNLQTLWRRTGGKQGKLFVRLDDL